MTSHDGGKLVVGRLHEDEVYKVELCTSENKEKVIKGSSESRVSSKHSILAVVILIFP